MKRDLQVIAGLFSNIKAMFARMQEGIVIHYMSTNYSSKRTQQFLKNNKCSLYYCVFKFVAEKGNYYHGLANIDFDIEELETKK